MPRIKREIEGPPRFQSGDLPNRLADELKAGRESGQPIIDEQAFPNGKLRVVVIWDEWDRLPLEERESVILQAYKLAEGQEYCDRIAVASALTVPEAHAAGMLPFEIIPARRDTDPVSWEQCTQAMINEGASTLLPGDKPRLRFARLEDAEAARESPRREAPW